MLKNLSVAAILLAAAIASAAHVNVSDNDNLDVAATTQFDVVTLDKSKAPSKKHRSSSSSSSDSDSSSTSSSTSDSSSTSSSTSDSSTSDSSSSTSDSSSSTSSSDSDSSTSSSSSSSDSDSSASSSDKKSKKSKKIAGTKAFKKSHGKKWLKSAEKAKDHEVAVVRQKSKIDSKGKKHKKAHKSKYATVKNALKLKSKKPIKITVDTNGINKGLIVKDGDKTLFKVKKDSKYAIIKEGTHDLTIAANKKGVEGTASIKVEEVKISKKIAKKYKIVANTVKAKDAQDLCERFGGNLAEIKEKDIAKIVKAAKKLTKAGINELWIDRVIKDDEEFEYLPYVLNLSDSTVVADPDNAYNDFTGYADKEMESIKGLKDNKKKYKKALKKVQVKIRKHMDKVLDGKDNTTPRAVLCRFD